MKRDKLVAIFLVLIFGFMTSTLHARPPKDCPSCWQEFKSSGTTIILTVEKTGDTTHLISLKNLRTELEKAKIGDRLIVELKLGKADVIKIGSFSPRVLREGETIKEKYETMAEVSFKLPEELKVMPTSGLLVVKDVRGKFTSSKLVEIEIAP